MGYHSASRTLLLALTVAALLAISCSGCTAPIASPGAITWQQTRGPSGGRINVLVIDSQNPNILYSGSEGGVYASRDGGTSWQSTSLQQGIRALALDPSASHTVYAGTDDGLYRSTDGGETWSAADRGSANGAISALVIDPTDTSTLYAGAYGQVLESTDGGDTWQTSGEGLPQEPVWALAIDHITPQVLYAGTDSGVFKSTDGGSQWQSASEGLRDRVRVQAFVMDPHLPSILYIATEAGVYRSTDAAVTWQSATEGARDVFVHSLAIDPSNTSVLYAGVGMDGVWKSADSGETWASLGDNIDEEVVLALAIHPRNSRLIYAGTGRGIYYSTTSGADWQLRNEGLTNTSVLSLVAVPSHPGHLYASTGLDVFRTADGGQTWSVVSWGLVRPTILALAVDSVWPETLYAGTWYSEVYRSTDGGRTWRLVNGGLARDAPINALAVHRAATTDESSGAGIVYAGTNGAGVFQSTDGGVNWTAINHGLGDLRVQVLEMAPTPQGTLYAGTSTGIYRLDLASTSAELSWLPAQQGLPASEVSSLVADRHSPNVLYASGLTEVGEIYRSTDGGSNWSPVGRGSLPTNAQVQALALNSISKRAHILYAGTNGGVFRSTDGGTTWRAINDGLPPRANVLGLAVDTQSHVYADVANNGVYSSLDRPPDRTWLLIAGGLFGLSGLAGIFFAARRVLGSSGRGPASMERVLERDWPRWREEMQNILRSRGEIGLDELSTIPKTLRLRALQKYMHEHGDDNLVLQANPPLLQPANAAQIRDLIQNWQVAQQNVGNAEAFEAAVSRITGQMCQLLGLTLLYNRSYKNLHGYVVRAPALRLRMPPLFPIVFLRDYAGTPSRASGAGTPSRDSGAGTPSRDSEAGTPSRDSEDSLGQHVADLHRLMDVLEVPSYLAWLIALDPQTTHQALPRYSPVRGLRPSGANGVSHQRRLLTRRDSPLTARLGSQREPAPEPATPPKRLIHGDVHDVVLLSFDDVFRIFIAKEPEQSLVRVLLEQIDLTIVSPYVTSGPVPENMFFGRDHELKLITRTIRDRNFAIVGGRKIGKTSILTKLHHIFSASESCHTLYLDCQAVKDYEHLCDAAGMIWRLPCAEPSPEHLVQALARLKQEHPEQVVIILLDEVDALLAYDSENEERLFKGLRALAQEGHCRLVFCGGRILVARLHDSGSALFNFCQTVRLGYLSPRDTGRIVLEPMQEMGIGFEDVSTVIQRVIDLSACHPNLVQYICQQLIIQINTRGDRFVQLSDLDEIESSQAFSEYLLEVMWSSAGALERLSTLLALDQTRINAATMKAALQTHGLDVSLTATEKALNGLVFCSILNKDGNEYSFAAPAFPSILTVTQDVNALLEQAVQAVRDDMASK